MVSVRSGLLLGGVDDVLVLVDKPKRRGQRVTHLLSLLNSPLDWTEIETPQGPPLAMYVCVADMPTADLLSHFQSCVGFIAEGREAGAVLVHCQYGISRSATVVLAYLMQSEKLSFAQALEQLREKKPDVRPNSGFVEQLKLWEAMKCRIDTRCKSYRAYMLRHQAMQMRETGYVDSLCMSPDPSSQQVYSPPDSPGRPVLYQCRKCRRLLFTSDNVIQHELGRGETAFKWHKQAKQAPQSHTHIPNKHNRTVMDDKRSPEQPSSSVKDSGSLTDKDSVSSDKDSACSAESRETAVAGIVPHTSSEQVQMREMLAGLMSSDHKEKDSYPECSSVFTEVMEWFGQSILGNNEGKLLCPKCGSRLGSFNWAGVQCSCGQWVTPSFQIHKNKLDIT